MAFVPGDWSITRNGAALDVRYIGDDHTGASPSYCTTIELHRALQDFADNEFDTAPDDNLSIIDQTPSDRGGVDTNITLLNGCNIDDASSQHVYDGSITQAGGATIYDGIQVFGNASIIQVIQNGARIDDDFWNYANHKAATSDAASSTTHRFMIKVRDGGADIDGRRLLGTQREWGTAYTEFFIGGGTNRGNNVLALTANPDNNNVTADTTVATWDTITNVTEGYNLIDIGGTNYAFYSEWDMGTQSKNDFYERAKWIQTRVGDIGGGNDTRDADQIIYGLDGDIFRGITHEINIDNPTGTFVEPESVSWATGTGQLLAIDSTTAGTKMWIQLLTGVAPTDGQTITGNGGATADVNVTVVARTVQLPFVGSSTGAAILGAFGSGIESADLGQNDRPIDLTGTTRTPPNNITFTVGNTISTDYVITANNSGGDFDFTQLATAATYNTAGITSVQMTASIPTDIPSSGTFRIELDTGAYRRITYSSFSGDTFTIPSTDFSGANAVTAGNNAFVTYIDGLAGGTSIGVTYVYASDRTLFTRVRNATPGFEIKTFETTTLVGSGGATATVGRIDDF